MPICVGFSGYSRLLQSCYHVWACSIALRRVPAIDFVGNRLSLFYLVSRVSKPFVCSWAVCLRGCWLRFSLLKLDCRWIHESKTSSLLWAEQRGSSVLRLRWAPKRRVQSARGARWKLEKSSVSVGSVCVGVSDDLLRFLSTSAKEMFLAFISNQKYNDFPSPILLRVLRLLRVCAGGIIMNIAVMDYNEPCSPLFSRNPLQPVSQANTLSKRSSLAQKPPRHRPSLEGGSKENAECTFEPRVRGDGRGRRTVEGFVRDQESFLRAKELKIQQLRLEVNRGEEESVTGTPQLDHLSRRIAASQRSPADPFDRLSRDRSLSSLAPEEFLFSPKILSRSKSMVRRSDVGTLLYEDARRRQEKEQLLAESGRRQADLLASPKPNRNTNALVLRRVLHELGELVTDETLSPILALSVIEELFNVDLNPNRQGVLVQKLVGVLAEAESPGVVRAERLREFVGIVVTGAASQESCFSPEQERAILEGFQHFYKERMTRERRSPTPERLTFRPKTLASSTKLASSFREKTCQQLQSFIESQKIAVPLAAREGGFSIEQVFQMEHLRRQSELERRRIEKENSVMEECTFKPDLAPSQASLHLLKRKPKVTLKAHHRKELRTEYTHLESENELRSTGKIDLAATKIEPAAATREERERRRRRREAEAAPLAENVRDAEKAVLRMSIGRQRREFSQSVLQRGYPKEGNWAQLQRGIHVQAQTPTHAMHQSAQQGQKFKGFTSK